MYGLTRKVALVDARRYRCNRFYKLTRSTRSPNTSPSFDYPMPTNLSRPSHRPSNRPSTIRRNLFRTLSRTASSNSSSSVAAAATATAAASTATSSSTTIAPSPFDSDDGIVVWNNDGSLDGAGEGQLLMQLVAGMQGGAGSLSGSGSGGMGSSGDRGGYGMGAGGQMEGAGLSEQERLAEMMKRHHGEMAKKLPGEFWTLREKGCGWANVSVDLLRQKVASLADDNWMFEAEEDGRGGGD
ncbi:hypothetical protein EV426DRAFT_398607 [Tirmania nivea]|nr:hypothetical protein EV426DRAFT_398607 [Tirmania nivea]